MPLQTQELIEELNPLLRGWGEPPTRLWQNQR
jgi:hypothetical protein